MTAAQCQSIQGIPVFDKEEGLVCDVKDGFMCSGAVIAPTECNDYEIRYFCQCSGELCVGWRDGRKGKEWRKVLSATSRMDYYAAGLSSLQLNPVTTKSSTSVRVLVSCVSG